MIINFWFWCSRLIRVGLTDISGTEFVNSSNLFFISLNRLEVIVVFSDSLFTDTLFPIIFDNEWSSKAGDGEEAEENKEDDLTSPEGEGSGSGAIF